MLKLLSGGLADKGQLQGFEFWLVIFNYDAPCGFMSVPPIRQLIQVPSTGLHISSESLLATAVQSSAVS